MLKSNYRINNDIMNIGDQVKVKGDSFMSPYPCYIKMMDDGEYYVCCEFECKWFDKNELEVIN